MELLDLPYEQLVPIYRLCDFSDLVSYACVSTDAGKSVCELLWHTVEVPWSALLHDDFQRRNLDNLKYTRVLRFRIRSCPVNTWDAFKANFERIVQHCDGESIVSFDVEGVLGTDGLVTVCKSFHGLQNLTLSNCQPIDGAGWEALGELVGLRNFRTNYPMNVDIVQHLETIPNLHELVFGKQCCITSEVVQILPQLKSLSKLTVLDANGVDCDILQTNKKLSELNIENGTFSIATDPDFDIGGFGSLKKLGLVYCNNITEETVVSLGQNALLETLHVVGQNWTDEKLVQLSQLPSLKVLDMGCGTNISLLGMSHVLTLNHLTHLYLYNCQGMMCPLVSYRGPLEVTVDKFLPVPLSG